MVLRKKKLLVLLILFYVSTVHAQKLTSDILLKIEENIIYYRAVEDYINHIEIDNYQHFIVKNKYFKRKSLRGNYKLDLIVKNTDLEFPDTNIVLYEIINPSQGVINLDSNTILTKESNSICFCKKFLVGFNTKSNQLFYIGGNFFKNGIYHYFDLSVTNPYTFEKYLKFKYYNYDFSSMKLIKKRKKYLVFRGFSEISKEYFYFKVGTKPVHNIENITFNISDRKKKRWDKK